MVPRAIASFEELEKKIHLKQINKVGENLKFFKTLSCNLKTANATGKENPEL